MRRPCAIPTVPNGSSPSDNAWLRERTIRAPRRLRPRAADGTELDLWILDPDRPEGAPLVLEIHGGPHAAYGAAFFFEFQILAAHGIGVAYGNPRGSQTYGEYYANCITGRWGNWMRPTFMRSRMLPKRRARGIVRASASPADRTAVL